VLASLAGVFYTHQADVSIASAHGNAGLILAAQNHAWRGMFLSLAYPGLVFLIGSFFLSESPRWLFQRGRTAEAMTALRRSSTEAEAAVQMREMQELQAEKNEKTASGVGDSILQRKYVVPFVLACIILGCNQATGINSILSYLVVILRQAGMTAARATQGDLAVKVLNCVMTVVAIGLIDRRGRKFLLTLGTSGIVIALLTACALFYSFESKRVEMAADVQKLVVNNELSLDVRSLASAGDKTAAVLTVLYNYGDGDHLVSKLSDDTDPVLKIEPERPKGSPDTAVAPQLTIKQAKYGAVASQKTGWLITACLALFIASFAVGPGVVVWLALSELMPTRIRSTGMGIALLINQFVSTGIAGIFPSVAGQHGYFVMFAFWAGCTVVYFITAAFFLPETKGRTLEEIERIFDRRAVVVGE
jgi:SP family myo-inositol transporter-like MFS transporter 13